MHDRCAHDDYTSLVSVYAYTSVCASTEVLVMGSLYISFKFHTQGDDPNATQVPLPEFMPNAGGLTHDLPDGVMVQLRLRLVNERYQVGVLSIMHISTPHHSSMCVWVPLFAILVLGRLSSCRAFATHICIVVCIVYISHMWVCAVTGRVVPAQQAVGGAR